MTDRFLQIHTLTSYPASLLNRDDAGFAKRVVFGGSPRIRISSQCLKRHWRTAQDAWALAGIPAAGGDGSPVSLRSRRIFESCIFEPLVAEGVDREIAVAVTRALMEALLPKGQAKQKKAAAEKTAAKAKKTKGQAQDAAVDERGEPGAPAAGASGDTDDDLRTSQVIILGRPEVEYLLGVARGVASEVNSATAASKAIEERTGEKTDFGKNLRALALGAGLDAALFGRMTTGDILARCDAAVHVAHAMTTHAGFFESDYFSAVDDLQPREETGSGHINSAELTTGVFYGYVVVDLPLLVSNLEGRPRSEWRSADRRLAAAVVERLIHLVSTISPGAKQGATAPYSVAHLVAVEHGSLQPRTMANAFLDAVPSRHPAGLLGATFGAFAAHLEEVDAVYGPVSARGLTGLGLPDAVRALAIDGPSGGSLADLATWSSRRVSA